MKKFIKYFVSVSLLLPVFSVKAAVLDVNVQCDDPAATNYMVITGINDTAFNAGSALDCVIGFRGNLEGINAYSWRKKASFKTPDFARFLTKK